MENRDFSKFLSFADAAAIWDLDDSALRHAVAVGRLIANEDCRKFGKQWIVRISAMCRLYGHKKYVTWLKSGEEIPTRRKQPQQVEGQISLTDSFTD